MESPPRKKRRKQLPPSLLSLANVFHGLRKPPPRARTSERRQQDDDEEGRSSVVAGPSNFPLVDEGSQLPTLSPSSQPPPLPFKVVSVVIPPNSLYDRQPSGIEQELLPPLNLVPPVPLTKSNLAAISEQDLPKRPPTRRDSTSSAFWAARVLSPLVRAQYQANQIPSVPLQNVIDPGRYEDDSKQVSVDAFLATQPKRYRGKKYTSKKASARKISVGDRTDSNRSRFDPAFLSMLKKKGRTPKRKKALESEGKASENDDSDEEDQLKSTKTPSKILDSLTKGNTTVIGGGRIMKRKARWAPQTLEFVSEEGGESHHPPSGRQVKLIAAGLSGTKGFLKGVEDTSFASTSRPTSETTSRAKPSAPVSQKQQKGILSRAPTKRGLEQLVSDGAFRVEVARKKGKQSISQKVVGRKQLEFGPALPSPPTTSPDLTSHPLPRSKIQDPLPGTVKRPVVFYVDPKSTHPPATRPTPRHRGVPFPSFDQDLPTKPTRQTLEMVPDLAPTRKVTKTDQETDSSNVDAVPSHAELIALLPTPKVSNFRFVTGWKAKRTPTLKFRQGWPTKAEEQQEEESTSEEEEREERPAKRRLIFGPETCARIGMWNGQDTPPYPSDAMDQENHDYPTQQPSYPDNSVEFVIDHEPGSSPPLDSSSPSSSSPSKDQEDLPHSVDVRKSKRHVSFSPIVIKRAATAACPRSVRAPSIPTSTRTPKSIARSKTLSSIIKIPASSGTESNSAKKRMRRLSLLPTFRFPMAPSPPPTMPRQSPLSIMDGDDDDDDDEEGYATHRSSHSFEYTEPSPELSLPPAGQAPRPTPPHFFPGNGPPQDSESPEPNQQRAAASQEHLSEEALWLRKLDPNLNSEGEPNNLDGPLLSTNSRSPSPTTSEDQYWQQETVAGE